MYQVNHSESGDEGEFYIELEGKKAFLKYYIHRGRSVLMIMETYTPPELRGRGIASTLMKHVLEYAKSINLKVHPLCSFAKHYIDKHPEYRELLYRAEAT